MRSSGNSECVGPCSSGVTSLGAVPAPIRKRRFSSAKIQPTRVKRVMQSDDEIGRMVASVPVAIGRAMEHFAEKLLETAAQCVLYSTSRTLSPSHIKQAVMQTPHFKFLESLVREIPLPPSAGSEMQWKTDLADQSSFSGFYPPGPATDPSCHMGIPMLAAQIGLPKLPSSGNLLSTKRRQSNGEMAGNETKPKRGRPRKVKKEEKCVDDDGLLLDDKPLGRVADINTLSNRIVLSDRELMPPPNVLPIRVLAATAFADNKRNSPSTSLLSSSKMNNNNGEQR
ncbi:Dr1-associated corepressor [Dirofilaria immitis]